VDDTIFEDPTSVKGIDQDQFSVYPVPAKTSVTISSKEIQTDGIYFIEDSFGRKLLSGKLQGKKTTIDVGNLAAGYYFIRMKDDDKKAIRFLKE
jgi:hypothetical protein